MLRSYFRYFVILINLPHLREAARRDSLLAVLTGIKCITYDRNLVHEFKCEVNVPSESGVPLWNMNLTLNREVADIEMRYKFSTDINGKLNKVIAFDMDYCRNWGNVSTNILLRYIIRDTKRIADMSCPLQKQHLYFFKNYNFSEFSVPKYLPPMKIISNADYYVQRKLTIATIIYAQTMQVTRKSLKEVHKTLKCENVIM